MNATPRVTFLLPVFNGAATIAATIDSILAQTMPDFELLILDDGSTDRTASIISGYRDHRIRLEPNPRRLRLPNTLNRGLKMARSEYVARIDADDLCLPQRAAIQANYLDEHPDVVAVGSYFQTFTNDAKRDEGTIIKHPIDSAAISVMSLFRNAIAHPSVMLRKSVLAAGGLEYDAAMVCGEDYDLWARCVMRRLNLANVPEVLVYYRVHAGQVTQVDAPAGRVTAEGVRRRLIEYLGLRPDPSTLAIHEAIGLDQFVAEAPFISAAAQWMTALAEANASRRCFDHSALMRLLTGRYVTLCRFARTQGLPQPDISGSLFAPYLHAGVVV